MKSKLYILKNDILNLDKSILKILLYDRTTKKNILWGTSDYEYLGFNYNADMEIEINDIIGINSNVIRKSLYKHEEIKYNRKKDMAEVFTPSWICNQQNNLIDDQWFGKKEVFNFQKGKKWFVKKEKIIFPNKKNRTWQDYVDARRMEIACGEAPYLVSRYDTVTGEFIELESRIGLLDRKMRIINENIDDEETWFHWTVRAFQSIYGYEFQGDNLLIARENLLFTFVDNVEFKFSRKPTYKELKEIAIVISWNIWQMDGLTYSVPYSEIKHKNPQLSFFDFLSDEFNELSNDINKYIEPKYCKIKNWRSSEKIIEYRYLMGE
ncbi:TPA: restriction endonuclease subunit M [Clostridium perfringens]|uniref:restriction endonuclease subunit M n=1 Tax=Clostridium perfringens TaxID=1502 RepID=UPI001CB42186|nr:restriction endonuclease subunit M [Clostridium perfringens]MDH5094224.1 hypothetical protein [Clostridium perfringens]MDK0534290.1 restriction endonuclease subunit M [Clostridium perfringens]MDK0740433.1 restriction endonuclease subunit M [Clostridium perfringens]MDK0984698.1 restriction endonuclease subunit M [Clostridium perfringens]HBI6988094.1 restriction endonuclease subunit M [Clostridium perfringens]